MPPGLLPRDTAHTLPATRDPRRALLLALCGVVFAHVRGWLPGPHSCQDTHAVWETRPGTRALRLGRAQRCGPAGGR